MSLTTTAERGHLNRNASLLGSGLRQDRRSKGEAPAQKARRCKALRFLGRIRKRRLTFQNKSKTQHIEIFKRFKYKILTVLPLGANVNMFAF